MMKYSNFLCIMVIVLGAGVAGENPSFSPSWGYNNNRIAVSADGNSEPDNNHKWPTGDPDDWGATPAALAILAKLQMQDKLVHYSYNNFIEAPAGPDEKNQMKIGVDGAVRRWDFDEKIFFDVTKDPAAAKNHLKKELKKSTANNRLYFIHMGPAEFFYQVVKEIVDEGHGAALAHVYIVSHSGYNDTHLRRDTHHTIPQAIAYSQDQLKYKRIKDQNGDWDPNILWNSKTDFSPWYWLRDHSDPNMRWLYQRVQAHAYGKADISDAGMLYWLLCGDENGSPVKFKRFIGDGVPTDNPVGPEPDNPKPAVGDPSPDGHVLVVEAETYDLQGDWTIKEGELASGGRYIEYTGPNLYDSPKSGQEISCTFTVPEAGNYTVKWFMRQPDHAEGDKSNDAWIYFPGDLGFGGDIKLTQLEKFVGRSKGTFGFNGQLDLHGNQPWMTVKFPTAGSYPLKISGRSERLQIDRVVLYKNMSIGQAEAVLSNAR